MGIRLLLYDCYYEIINQINWSYNHVELNLYLQIFECVINNDSAVIIIYTKITLF